MAEDDRIEKHMQKAGVRDFTVYRETHRSMCERVGVREWNGMEVAATYRQDGNMKTAYLIVHSAED